MTKLNNGKTIKIQIGKVNQPIVEEILDNDYIEASIFCSQYKQMLSMLNRYAEHRVQRTSNIDSCPNNIFTFVGERGSGKTSCMSSIAHLLGSSNLSKFSNYKALSELSFTTIDMIDPSYFDEEHNIVAMMVAKLYKSFRTIESENDRKTCNYDKRRELIDAFGRAQRSMSCLLNKEKEQFEADDIEKLADLSIAVDLRGDIDNLVKSYLSFLKKEEGVLVLCIDDIDLNIGEADTMAEQIRKYLVSSNIIVLLAAKLDQLATIKNRHYADQYKYLIDKGHIDYSIVEEMTGQFLTKFAPHDQRVYMPTADFYFENGIDIIENDIKSDTMNGVSVKQAIPELIFNRTRYLFYNSRQSASYIIPRNLRKLCQLVALVWPMEPYEDSVGEDNKAIFRNYLFSSWVQDNLGIQDRSRVSSIIDGWHKGQLNKTILDVLHKKYKTWFDDFIEKKTSNIDSNVIGIELSALINDRNQEFNYSAGDILSLIFELHNSFDSYRDKCFLFIIQSIYSMALYESYDMVTERMDEESYDEKDDMKSTDNNQVLLFDPFMDEHVYDYHKLVGGRFYNYRLSTMLARDNSTKMLTSERIINYSELDRLITESVKLWNDYKKANNENKSSIHDKLTNRVRLSEFFMLCTIRDINLRNKSDDNTDYYNPTFRQIDYAYYNGDYAGKSWLYFDLGAFFYNITNMRVAYMRFKNIGQQFYGLCYDDKECISLYSTFRKMAHDYRKNYKESHAWQSWASLRNAEIVADLHQHIRSKCRNTDADNRVKLQKFFEALSNYSIHTYDRNAKKDSYLSINFEFAKIISSLLKDASINEDFTSIYNVKFDKVELNPIDVIALLKGRHKNKNKKETIINAIVKQLGVKGAELDPVIRMILGNYPEYITRDQVREAANTVNFYILYNNGDTKRDTEDSIPQSEPQINPGEK